MSCRAEKTINTICNTVGLIFFGPSSPILQADIARTNKIAVVAKPERGLCCLISEHKANKSYNCKGKAKSSRVQSEL